MRKLILYFSLLILTRNSALAQIPIIRTDSVKPVNPNLPQRDLTLGYMTNSGFEDGLFGWTATGNAFSQLVGGNMISSERVRTEMLYDNGGIGGDYWKNMSYPLGTKGNRWMGSYERGNGDAATGTLRSEPFKINKQYLYFLLGGGNDMAKLFVELQVKESPVAGYGKTSDGYTRVKRITPEINSEELFRYWFDIPQLLGQPIDTLKKKPPTVRIVIVDSATAGPWGHINIDDFIISDCPNDFLVISREGKRLYADKDRPVWGFADTHTHPMAHLAFGGKTMTGGPDGPMEMALATSQCVDNNHQPGNGLGFIGIQVYNWHLPYGYPTFSGWPKFNVQLHQPMYIDWIKRAYEGGLKLICVLGVTNMFWSSRAMGPGVKPELPLDDESVALLAIEEFKKIVDNNKDWMEVALTPRDARRIILSNKLAVILGVEMDNFGNFKDATYVFREPYAMPPSKPLGLLAPDNNQPLARAQILKKINEYHDLGIRQVTPLHYITGVFGGTAVFRYQFGMIQSSFTGKPYLLNDGRNDGVNYNLNKDVQAFQAILGAAWEVLSGDAKAFYTCSMAGWSTPDMFNNHCEDVYSTVNGHGLFPRGEILYQELMKKGFIIDVDHTSRLTSSRLFVIAKNAKYPLLSSHTDPAETCLGPKNPLYTNISVKWGDDPELNFRDYRTTAIGNLSTEFTPTKKFYQQIAESGGMAGLFTFPFRKDQSLIKDRTVANDCDGSSRSWAQNYLYLLETMKGKGIALATDKGFTEAVGPRFGPMAAYKLIEEKTDYLKKILRQQQRWKQDAAVKYDIPYYDWNPRRFEMGDIDAFEEDLWKAFAFWATHPDMRTANPKAHPQYNDIPPSQYAFQTDRIKHLVIGLAITDPNNLLPTGILSGTDQPWQQAIMYCYSHNTVPGQLPKKNYEGLYLNTVQEKYVYWKPVFDLWQRMVNGKNEPLRKLMNGNRDWDYNIDGMAHYGMIPDFIQDLKNIGIRTDQMMPLFSSAEEYIRMWEKADSASAEKSTTCRATSSTVTQTACNSYTSPSGKHTWTVSGIYKDTIENKTCCDSLITINLTIKKIDTAVTVQNNILTARAKGASYQWINCVTNEPVPNATAVSLSQPSAGNYAVRVTLNGCVATSSCYAILASIRNPIVKPLSMPLQKFSGANKIVASDRKNNAHFGQSVSISNNYAIVGVPLETTDANNQTSMNGAGAAYIFERRPDSTWKQIQKIAAADRTPGDNFGCAVGISGNYIIVGAVYDREDAEGKNPATAEGSAYIFERNANGTWSQVQKVVASGRTSYDYYGTSVAIDGNTLVVGAIGHSRDTTNKASTNFNDAGALFVFERTDKGWKETQKLVAKDRSIAILGENLGISVSISGNHIIGGAWGSRLDTSNANKMESAGAAYVFERSAAGWKQAQKLVAGDRTPYDEFGYSVAISGSNAIVGARRTTATADENSYAYTGNAYIFSRNSAGAWNQVLKVIPDDRKAEDRLGTSVAMLGDYAIIGSPGSDITNPNEGGVYVYWQSADGKWTQSQKLSSSDHGSYAGMGVSVAITEGVAIAGAVIEHRDLAGKNELSNAGAAYTFKLLAPAKKAAPKPGVIK